MLESPAFKNTSEKESTFDFVKTSSASNSEIKMKHHRFDINSASANHSLIGDEERKSTI